MSESENMVYCQKLKKQAPKLMVQPMPGEIGQWILENISATAWKEWQMHQTRLINEKQLNLLDRKTRTYLIEQMKLFFNNEAFDQASGYVEQDKK